MVQIRRRGRLSWGNVVWIILLTQCRGSRSPEDPLPSLTDTTLASDLVFEARPSHMSPRMRQPAARPQRKEPTLVSPEDLQRPGVQFWLRDFATRDRERFERFLRNGEPYREMIAQKIAAAGLPPDLVYLPLIESGYQNRAHSRAGASGMWQFMRGTGKRFGLTVHAYVDERCDPVRATDAAVTYLSRLYQVFRSWPLALAAYNAGESRVMNAILRRGTRDYWELVRQRALPRETRHYVPKLLAAIAIGRNLTAQGMAFRPDPQKQRRYAAVEVPSPVTLRDIATVLELSPKTLADWNPHLLQGVTPAHVGTYRVWHAANVPLPPPQRLAQLKRIPPNKLGLAATQVYQVRSGDSLWGLARRFNTSVQRLSQLNHLPSPHLRPGQQLRVPRREVASNLADRYRVRAGDYLSGIARRFGAKVSDLKRWNRLASNEIFAGQVLQVTAPSGA